MKDKFIENELWILTFGGGFQRVKIYKKGVNAKTRSNFRDKLKNRARVLVKEYYEEKECSSQNHINNLIEFSAWTGEEFASILNNGKLNIGVTQKIINLYLKYLWCLGKVKTPPHCPFDRIIISKLIKTNIPAWTKIENVERYCTLIEKAREKAGTLSIAEWELGIFARRNS